VSSFCREDGETMKPRFCVSPIGVSDAVATAWQTFVMLYNEPRETDRDMLRAYVHKLVIKSGETDVWKPPSNSKVEKLFPSVSVPVTPKNVKDSAVTLADEN
jgi:hypothetical protein